MKPKYIKLLLVWVGLGIFITILFYTIYNTSYGLEDLENIYNYSISVEDYYLITIATTILGAFIITALGIKKK